MEHETYLVMIRRNTMRAAAHRLRACLLKWGTGWLCRLLNLPLMSLAMVEPQHHTMKPKIC